MDRTITAHASSKRPRTIVAGPYGHPFHPILVTIPIGTWVASFVFDIIALVADDPEPYIMAANILILIGLIGAVLAAAVGLLDLSMLERGTAARKTALVHMTLNLVIVVLFLASLLVRWAHGDEDISVIGFILSIVALALLGISGWLGGKLAYHYGVRVADEKMQAEGYR